MGKTSLIIFFVTATWGLAGTGLTSPVAPPQPPQWQQEATTAEKESNYPRAITLYRAQLTSAPNPLPIKLALGRVLLLAGRDAEARTLYNDVLTTNPQNVRAMLGMAAVEVRARKVDTAHEWIGRAVEAGALPVQLESVPDLASLRSSAAYKTHIERANRLANPCRYEPEYAAFDFWTGDWDVYVNGQLIARNIVTREMNGCIIHERYQTTNGAIRGESINYYDALERRWKQNWVSNSANVIAYVGNPPRDGVMEMTGTSVGPGFPNAQLQQVVWERQADGGLTQTVRVSNDNGKTWSPGFAGRYVRSNRPLEPMNPDDRYPVNTALSGGTTISP